MRHIEKGSEPEYLTEHKEVWLKKFLEKCKAHPDENIRPDSKKYAHPQIVDALWSASHGKCYYCECPLDAYKEVDHFIEVSERKDLAFDWQNLYLSCNSCNDKKNNKSIPVDKALDPCKDSDEEIQKHITFIDEVPCAIDQSEKGLLTIQKYKLDSKIQYEQRRKHLVNLAKEACRMTKNGGINSITDAEKAQLRAWASPTAPYSYMSEKFLYNLYPELFE